MTVASVASVAQASLSRYRSQSRPHSSGGPVAWPGCIPGIRPRRHRPPLQSPREGLRTRDPRDPPRHEAAAGYTPRCKKTMGIYGVPIEAGKLRIFYGNYTGTVFHTILYYIKINLYHISKKGVQYGSIFLSCNQLDFETSWSMKMDA